MLNAVVAFQIASSGTLSRCYGTWSGWPQPANACARQDCGYLQFAMWGSAVGVAAPPLPPSYLIAGGLWLSCRNLVEDLNERRYACLRWSVTVLRRRMIADWHEGGQADSPRRRAGVSL